MSMKLRLPWKMESDSLFTLVTLIFICNWTGNKTWSGHEEFAAAKDTPSLSTAANEQSDELCRTKDGHLPFSRSLMRAIWCPWIVMIMPLTC